MPTDSLQQAGLLYQNGKRAEARELLLQIVQREPANARAWYGLSLCEEDAQKRTEYLSRVISIDPNHAQARKMLDELTGIKTIPTTLNNTLNRPINPSADTNQPKIQPQPSLAPQRAKPAVITRHRNAGGSTYEMAEKRRNAGLTIGIVVMILIAVMGFCVLPNAKALSIGSSSIAIVFFLIIFAPKIVDFLFLEPISKKWKRAVRGAEAEEEIGEILDELSDDFLVLNDIESPYGNIDHVVIGKNQGVFLIETKSHHGKVEVEDGELLVSGKTPEKDFIAQTLKNTYWLRDEICEVTGSKPWITAIIVFTNAFVERTKPIKGITIINKKYLPTILQRHTKPNATQAKIWEMKEEIADEMVG